MHSLDFTILRGKPFTYRLKIREEPINEQWQPWIIQPVPEYLETPADGPYPYRDIEWMEINPVRNVDIGTLLPPSREDHSSELHALLDQANIPYEKINEIYRILIKLENSG